MTHYTLSYKCYGKSSKFTLKIKLSCILVLEKLHALMMILQKYNLSNWDVVASEVGEWCLNWGCTEVPNLFN